MHADGPRAVGPHGKPVEASASTTASDVGDIWKSVSKNLKVASSHTLHEKSAIERRGSLSSSRRRPQHAMSPRRREGRLRGPPSR